VKHPERTEEIMQAVCADFGAQLREFNGEADHVHLLVNFPPTIAISRLVNSLKGVSSRRLRQEFCDLRRHYWRAKRLRSGPYFADSVAGPRSLFCASTSSSRTARADRLTPGRFTTGLKADALAATLAAADEGLGLVEHERAASFAERPHLKKGLPPVSRTGGPRPACARGRPRHAAW
jgi:putative transposase